MSDFLNKLIFGKKHSPRWVVFIIDLILCVSSVCIAYLLRFNFNIPEVDLRDMPFVVSYILFVRIVSFYLGKPYAGIVRYTSTKDAQRILLVVFSGSLVFAITNLLTFNTTSKFIIPFSLVVLDFIITCFLMVSTRTLVKVLYYELKNPSREKTKVVIYGAGESGHITKRTLDRDAGTKYKVIAMIDDDKSKWGKKIEGVKIVPPSSLKDFLEEGKLAFVIISIQKMKPSKKQEIFDFCAQYNTRVLSVPPVSNWINGNLSFKQIKKINIEELLERDEINIHTDDIENSLKGKTVLVSGAAGSIGSEIARQLINFNPSKIILLDQAESPMYDLLMELGTDKLSVPAESLIADIRNKPRMEQIFKEHKPNIVFHAAAYKHVPLMEENPAEAVQTNIKGTRILADLSHEYRVEKFVMVSTDKAVNPTSVMGASKRVAEIYTQSLNSKSETAFVTTRFGNVLGSNGSVIPLFRRQIEKGGPITITHPEITRYFMTITEACRLVLEAGTMGKGGEIFIFDMGKSVKIIDLAKKMIRLSGLTLDKDIKIEFTGLRPGEKLYEELLNNNENTLPTHNQQIMIAKVREYEFIEVVPQIDDLIKLSDNYDEMALVSKIKEIVPEYVSNNSVFESLDK